MQGGPGDTGSLINTTLRVYDDGQTAVFTQYFHEALSYMSAQDGDTSVAGVTDMVTAFPSFQTGTNSTPISYLTYCNASMSSIVVGEWFDGAYQGSTAYGLRVWQWYILLFDILPLI